MSTPVFRVTDVNDSLARAINIELWGFKDCQHTKPLAIARAVQLLPSRQLEGLKQIRYEEHALIPGLQRWVRLRRKSRHRGRYDHEEKSILLHRCDNRAQLFHTLFHELGHFVYFRIISSREKKQWVQDTYRQEAAVSHYGRRNAAEDFAEAFVLYVLDPQKLTQTKGKYRFMREIVFRGVAVDQTALAAIVSGSRGSDRDFPLDKLV